MPAKMSTTLLLHRFGGLSIEECGKQLGVSRPAAKKYLARALIHCRDALEEGADVAADARKETSLRRASREAP